jgi:serine/threonine protein kinase
MKRISHEILIMANSHHLSDTALEKEMESINSLLDNFESPDNFCMAHELVNRNSITQRKSKILREIRYQELRAFRFLISKN